MLDLGHALEAQQDALVEDGALLLQLRGLVDSPQDLTVGQWFQIYAATLEFAPDLVIELGRGYGNTTAVFTQAANRLGSTRVVSVGYDFEQGWKTRTVPRIEKVTGTGWFAPLTVRHEDILDVDFAPLVAGARRVLLWWDAHGDELAAYLLSHALPLFRGRDHLVCVHDITDTRYEGDSNEYVRSDGWPIVWQGYLSCPFEELVPIYDFISRNHVPYETAAGSLAAFRKQPGAATVAQRLREVDAAAADVLTAGGWMWFDLAGGRDDLAFPSFERKVETGDEPRQDGLGSPLSAQQRLRAAARVLVRGR